MCSTKNFSDIPVQQIRDEMRKKIKKEERMIRRKLIIAALGVTKAGKTSFIAALAKEIRKLVALFLGDKNRTKVTVDYHFVPYLMTNEHDLMLEKIDFRLTAIAKSNDFSSTEKYNAEVINNPIYKLLGLETIEDAENFEVRLQQMLDEKVSNVTPKDLAKLLNTEGIDEYIKKVTILVEATDVLADVLMYYEIDLILRDTRGIMDLALEKNEEGTRITNIRSLSDLGLDGLSGILFFCSRDGYTNNILQIYEDTLKNVFKSVPVFLVRRSEILPLACQIQGGPQCVDDAITFMEAIQLGKNVLFPDFEVSNFQTTLKLLFDLGVTKLINQRYIFNELFFEQNQIEFLIPDCRSLTSASTVSDVTFNIEEADYKQFQLFGLGCITQVLKMISQLDKLMEYVVNGGVAGLIQGNKQYLINDINDDLKKYDLVGENTQLIRPQLQSYKIETICGLLLDHDYEVLGPRGGITTVRNGSLRYAPTAVLAVSSRIAISSLIEKIDTAGVVLPVKSITQEQQVMLIKRALRFVLYRSFTDVYATIQGYLLVPREVAVEAIKSMRKKSGSTSIPFEICVASVLDIFCNTLSNANLQEIFIK